MLNEEEIFATLREIGIGHDDYAWVDMREAAHAIAEKMAEGVVWEGDALWVGGAIRWLHKQPDQIYWSSEEEKGQLVTVTVSKKEERDGQETTS